MRYKRFRIRNFKGIQDTEVEFESGAGANVFAFVGLNESGKTTILEALHSFAPDRATSKLVGGDDASGVPYPARVPRHLFSQFSEEVTVTATLSVTSDDWERIVRELDKKELQLRTGTLPEEITMERAQRFHRGDFKKNFFTLKTDIEVKSPKQKKWRRPSTEEHVMIRDVIFGYVPLIAFFPTFVFNFPKEILLTNEESDPVNTFYKEMFQDILDFDGHGHSVEHDIVRRVRSEKTKVTWLSFLSAWNVDDSKDKIQHVMDRAGATVTNVVFGRWNKIFREDARGKEVVIPFSPVEGEKKDASGAITKTNEHDIAITFKIRDGTRRFDVNDRSLGFRWFFAFMLFTQFRAARKYTRPILFLFDEPASNLHAAAQQKLIESFPAIATGGHALAYTTHSHYMIEPKWLDQTFIVTNRADAPSGAVLDAVSLDDESLDVRVTKYSKFVNQFPGKTSYFQPVLDRLEVVPSRFDIQRSSVIVEGKSDYFVLRYAAKMLNRAELPLVPGVGAGTFGALVALHVGWGLKMIFLLDGDTQGKTDRERYVADFGLPLQRALTLDEVVPGLKVIEDLLDRAALTEIQQQMRLSRVPNKKDIRRFFQERLASGNAMDLGNGFALNAGRLLDQLEQRLQAEQTSHK
jgi:ABC-type Na+ transport system ATPase subunit NatA